MSAGEWAGILTFSLAAAAAAEPPYFRLELSGGGGGGGGRAETFFRSLASSPPVPPVRDDQWRPSFMQPIVKYGKGIICLIYLFTWTRKVGYYTRRHKHLQCATFTFLCFGENSPLQSSPCLRGRLSPFSASILGLGE